MSCMSPEINKDTVPSADPDAENNQISLPPFLPIMNNWSDFNE